MTENKNISITFFQNSFPIVCSLCRDEKPCHPEISQTINIQTLRDDKPICVDVFKLFCFARKIFLKTRAEVVASNEEVFPYSFTSRKDC